MKSHRISAFLMAAVLVLSYSFPMSAVNAHTLSETSENADPISESEKDSDSLSDKDSSENSDTVSESEKDSDSLSDKDCAENSDTVSESEKDSDSLSDKDSSENSGTVSESEKDSDSLSDKDCAENPDIVSESDKDSGSLSDKGTADNPDTATEPEKESVSENTAGRSPDLGNPVVLSDIQIPDEQPVFSASIQKIYSGYVVRGCFTEFLPDTITVQPQSSLDGATWQDCGDKWNLSFLEDPECLDLLQNQICLYGSFEPLKSYLDGQIDHFYLRLSITRKNGMTYETQAAHIARGEPLPIPEEITCIAGFSPTMLFRKEDSSGAHSYCGQYQLTVSDSASTEEVMALLPDTLPIEVEFHKDRESFADCTIDCPVSWKPLSLSGLRAGESITIWNAAEELLIPAGTSLCTPMGTFTLEEPLGIVSESWMSDEVVLILNVVAEGAHPTGVLSGSIHGLEMAFDLKPTGAAAIRAYTLTDGDSEWKELPGLPLLDAVNAQPATANSGYTTILSAEQEPFRSYLADEYAGEEPTPFLVRLTIEGGVYDDCQLILAYPDTYDFPPDLRVDGAGGNQGNAGTGNRDDSTEEGQRPNLPQTPVDEMTEQQASILADETDNTGSRQTGTADHPADSAENKQTNAAERSSDNAGNRQADTAERSTNHTQNLQSNTAMPAPAITQTSADESKERPLNPVLPVAAASIAGIYITIMVTKIIAGMKAGGITIKKP